MKMPLPCWLKVWLIDALIGEIYPSIRAIAVSFSDEKILLVRYYLDRVPIEEDYENMSIVMTEVMANTTKAEEIVDVKEECVFSELPLAKIDPLNGFVYARKE